MILGYDMLLSALTYETTLAPAVMENCERCGELMPEECIGWCAECDKREKAIWPIFDCICWWNDFSGFSILGKRCTAHGN